jgi:hypothetical protein
MDYQLDSYHPILARQKKKQTKNGLGGSLHASREHMEHSVLPQWARSLDKNKNNNRKPT